MTSGPSSASGPSFSPGFCRWYVILGLLGEGGMGAVYLAEQVALGRRVALKVLKGYEREDLARFEREARVLSSLNHSRILKVLDYGVDVTIPYLVTELVEGKTLDVLLRERRFEPHEALRVTAQVAEALEYAHQQGVVHRDVKPANVFLVGEDVVLADFGLARRSVPGETVTSEGTLVGTPAYMAPELIKGSDATPAC